MIEQATDAVVKCDDVSDPYLACDQCGGFICQLDDGDSLSILVQMAADHECEADDD